MYTPSMKLYPMGVTKRPRASSPDILAINNYKRAKLIDDLERLTISPSSYGKQRELIMPKNVTDDFQAFLGGQCQNTDLERIYQEYRHQNLQIVTYKNPALLIYQRWCEWYIKNEIVMSDTDTIIGDMDMDCETPGWYTYDNEICNSDYMEID